jgi:SUMO ligase MMS21 Smc5/6 complex component
MNIRDHLFESQALFHVTRIENSDQLNFVIRCYLAAEKIHTNNLSVHAR